MKTQTRLVALHLAMENAAGRYLIARKALIACARHLASHADLVAQQPRRLDYRLAHRKAAEQHATAVERAGLAYRLWQEASSAYDVLWTATHGRAPRPVATTFEQAA